MAATEDDFGDFSSAFSPGELSSAPGKTISSNGTNSGGSFNQNGGKTDFIASFPTTPLDSSHIGGNEPSTSQAFGLQLSFDAFSDSPAGIGDDLGQGMAFADFGQINFADVAIPDPSTVEIGGYMFDIPPLPEELEDLGPAPSSAGGSTKSGAVPATVAGMFPDSLDGLFHTLGGVASPQTSQATDLSVTVATANAQEDGSGGLPTSLPSTTMSNHVQQTSLSEGRGTLSSNDPSTCGGREMSEGLLAPGTAAGGTASDNESDFGDFESSIDPSKVNVSQWRQDIAAPSSDSSMDSRTVQPEVPNNTTNLTSHSSTLEPASSSQEGFVNFSLASDSWFGSQQPSTAGQDSLHGGDGSITVETGFGAFMEGSKMEDTVYSEVTSDPLNIVLQESSMLSTTPLHLDAPGERAAMEGALDFGAFQQPDKTEDSSFGKFEDSSSNKNAVALKTATPDAQIRAKEVGGFAGIAVASTMAVASTKVAATTGSFEPFAATPGASEGGNGFGEFGNFSHFHSSSSAGDSATFANFESASVTQSDNTRQVDDDSEFGGFEAFSDSQKNIVPTDDDFGEFTSPNLSNELSHFGQFPSTPLSSVQPHSSTTTSHSEATKGNAKVSSDVLVLCFPCAQDTKVPPHSATQPTTLFYQLRSVNGAAESQSGDGGGVWRVLQRCVDFTVPLHKWDKSYLQDCYYGALKVDPMLVSKPGVLPVLDTGLGVFDNFLGGQSAAEDLMESFGFEGGPPAVVNTKKSLPPRIKTSSSSKVFGENQGEAAAPALLDLSLPTSPIDDTEQDPLSGALAIDLLGLDLTVHSTSQLTSIQQLMVNEQLIVKQSTWKDSQLIELEKQQSLSDSPSESPPLNSSHQPSPPTTPRSGKRRGVNLEQQLLQLGLDTSKTSAFSGSAPHKQGELSLSARTILGRLPDLSYMLSDSLVERNR